MEYGVAGIPYSAFIDAQRSVVGRFMGEITREVVRSAVQRLEAPRRC
jgi:hypothetical protein